MAEHQQDRLTTVEPTHFSHVAPETPVPPAPRAATPPPLFSAPNTANHRS